eukprot:scaffold5102_cov76-Cyclotella_meneghiniana.AAC.2
MASFLSSIPKECIGTNGLGTKYAEFSCLHPALANFYLPFEKFYDPVATLTWMQDRPMIPVWACVLYVVLIFAGRQIMKNKPAWSWRRTLALWNCGLSLFSWIGALRTAPQLYYNLTHYPLRDNLCDDPAALYGSGSTGLWVQLFILSKFPELLDTFFIVIHKKPLIFLHWYHHITVLLYCWHSYVTTSPSGLFFVVMNYSVHAVMYGYYFLMAIKMKPKWFNPIIVTFLQLSQMFIGVGVTIVAFYYYNNPILGKFFVGRYFAVKVKGEKKKKYKNIAALETASLWRGFQ